MTSGRGHVLWTILRTYGTSDARSIAMFAALDFCVVWAVAVFDQVEMRIVGCVEMS